MTAQVVLLRAAFEARLQAMSGYLGDGSTQWENTLFTPDAAAPYQIVNILLGEPANPERGGFFQEQGYCQITLRYPNAAGPGTGDAYAMAQKIRDQFYKNLQLAAGAVSVQINKTPTIGPGVPDGDRYSLPIKIRFFANNAS